MDAQDIQDLFLGECSALILGIRNPGSDHRAGQHPGQHPPVLLILCILYIHLRKNTDPRYRFSASPTHRSATPRQGGSDPVLSPETLPPGAGSRCTVYLCVTGMQKVSASSQAK